MAMGITQALKLQEGPINALAQLPQQQLMAMAQQGRIPADMLPIILNEKAEMAQAAANMQAMAKPMPASVTERNMAINAQAEAPQAQSQMMAMAPQQEMPPMDTGVASLPVPEEMYGNEYAGGGIVAFQAGGDLNDEEYLRALERDRSKNYPLSNDEDYERPGYDLGFSRATQQRIDNEGAGFNPSAFGLGATMPAQRIPFKARTVEDIFTSGNVLREREAPASKEREVINKYLEDQARKTTDVRTDAWTRALEAGLGILGGESPYALTNIGKGSQAAVKGFAEDVKERRKQTMADMQLKLQLDEAARKEKLDAISSAERIAMSEREREARGEESALDRASREETARLDRENRLAIANIPDKTLQAAAQLRKNDPKLSYLDSVSQAAQALAPKDTYNATRTAVSSAAKDANAEFMQRATFDPKLQEDMKKAAAGDAAAQARVKAIKDKIQQETFKLYQVQGVDLSSGRMGAPNVNDPLGIR
jgi:hypothetical protein